jgi:hypothetical protein
MFWMKSSISTFALATLVAIASLTQAHAQNLAARVNVPFAFDFGSEHFSAGAYTISMLGDKVVGLRNNAHPSARMAIIESISDLGSPNEPTSVTFRKYGNSYFLAEYSTSGTTITLSESKTERSLAREYAANQANPGSVQVAALGK